MRRKFLAGMLAVAAAACAPQRRPTDANPVLLNVSYDPTRELYRRVNAAFARDWEAAHPDRSLAIEMSHGGSAKQARAVAEGLRADVVTLALGFDIDRLAKAGLVAPNWRERFPFSAAPYTSTIVFVVRQGNPKAIRDWPDLVRDDVQVITPNPKTSGGARWNYLSAWLFAERAGGADFARKFVDALYGHVPVLDTGARAAATTFVQRGIGDVMINWESEARLAAAERGGGQFEVVYPSISILPEPPIAIVEPVVERKGTRALAQSYLGFLYTQEGQRLIAQSNYRPRDAAIMSAFRENFPDVETVDIRAAFGGWEAAHRAHFAEGAIFDQITARRR